ncbi:cellulase family glycosylhydrolase [Anaerolineales bacterium HSG25]|nr:cellulase family glycosylhydrolase [Anaerolineales bacterium HSG25]
MINKNSYRRNLSIMAVLVLLTFMAIVVSRRSNQTYLFNLTGEEEILPQISGITQYLLTRLQPPLQTADNVPVQYAGMNPYGVNTFLQNEVEPAKREQALRLISEAGIKWVRQEFTWEDIEIHGKGDFEDRRHEPYKSAWEKYDQIVDFAEKYDLKIMARLSNPPAWTRAMTDTVGAFAPPDDYQDYGDFVTALATRYRGRIPAYQIWNEPNIYPEWGEYPISAEEYTELLKVGYQSIKKADPDAIVVMGALAATIELDRQRRYSPTGFPTSPGGLSDVLFLQQLYNAGAAPYFDVLAMQGYGLWSGPTDRRMQPRVLNFSRPLYVRDVMVRNGDAHKAIWLSELGWNVVPPESGLPPIYGQVTLEQQARYTQIAYQRIQKEWPWLGVGFYWFFKQADDREKLGNPQYYFRMMEPDFTPLPIYEAIKTQANDAPVLYAGWQKADHWAIEYHGTWSLIEHAEASFGSAMQTTEASASFSVIVDSRRVRLKLVPSSKSIRLQIQVDQQDPFEVTITNEDSVTILEAWRSRQYRLNVELLSGAMLIDGLIVE